MRIRRLHSWDLTPKEAVALQRQLRDQVDTSTPLRECDVIAAADVSYNRFSNVIFAGAIVWRASDNTVVERQAAVLETHFPYVPGLLSFREAPPVLATLAKLRTRPDVVLIDGQGYAHPRRMGIASHVGLFLDVPTVGCAKSRLYGEFDPPGPDAGSTSPLVGDGEVVGQVLRTRDRVSPLFVSCGSGIDLAGAVRAVITAVRGRRLPEPARLAHQFVNDERRKRLGRL